MNTRVRIGEQGMREDPEQDRLKILVEEKKMEGITRSKVTNSKIGPKRCMSRRERKIALEQDVDKLRRKLKQEVNVHRALERALTRPLGALPRLPSYLPSYTLELLAEVAVLEEEVVRLEEQVLIIRLGFYQEAIYISESMGNMEENGLELCSLNTMNIDQHKSYSPLANSNASSTSSSLPSKRWTLLAGNPKLSSLQFMDGTKLRKKLIFSLPKDPSGKENQSNKNASGSRIACSQVK